MTIERLDHVSVVVDDLAAAIAFFSALGMTLERQQPVEGPWVDRVNGLERVQVDIVMMRTPDGHGRLELTMFRNPGLVEMEPAIAPPNALGLRSVMCLPRSPPSEKIDGYVGPVQRGRARLASGSVCTIQPSMTPLPGSRASALRKLSSASGVVSRRRLSAIPLVMWLRHDRG